MEKIITLSPEEILKKRFKVSFKGYDAEEVDGLLDRIILDYRTMIDFINEVEKKKEDLYYKIKFLTKETEKLKNQNALLNQQVESLLQITSSNSSLLELKKIDEKDIRNVKGLTSLKQKIG